MKNSWWSKLEAAIILVTILIFSAGLAKSAAYSRPSEYSQAATGSRSIIAGAYIPPIYFANTEYGAFNQLIGKDAGIIMEFYPWQLDLENGQCGYLYYFFGHDRAGICHYPPGPEIHAALMLTWGPAQNPQNYPSCNVWVNGKTNWDAIINGSCDGYIDNFATRIKNWSQQYGDIFMIRFAHEMNIYDNPWWQDDPNYPGKYVQAFRHVRNRFNLVGATNQYAQFVWSPNYQSNPNVSWNSIPNYYPGDSYVDWIGLSGFNWGSSRPGGWQTFSQIFDATDPNLGNTGVLRYLQCHYAKPIILAEWGSVEGPGGSQTKAAWIADAYARMQDFPYVRAAVWHNDYAYHNTSQPDFRITAGSSYDPDPFHSGSQSALSNWTQAYATAISNPVFTSTLPPLSQVTPSGTYCGPIPPIFPGLFSPEFLLATPGSTIHASVSLNDLTTTVTLSASGLPGGYAASFAPLTLGPHSVFPSTSTALMTISVPSSATGTDIPFTVSATGAGLVLSDTTTLKVRSKLYYAYFPFVVR
jgi:hypothetical protein